MDWACSPSVRRNIAWFREKTPHISLLDSFGHSATIGVTNIFQKRKRITMFKTKKSKIEVSITDRIFSSAEIAEIAGVSLRQLQWWDEQKVVSPRHEGHKRIYLAEEAVEIATIAELRRKGFSLQKIRRVLRFLEKEMTRRVSEVFSTTTDMHLVTDGKAVYLEVEQSRIIEIFKSAVQPMFLVCVTDLVNRLSLPAMEAPARKPARTETAPALRKARAV